MNERPSEQPVLFECAGQQLVGMLHHGSADASRGVLIVVGGPQYRVGSHRQFVLLARSLAASGFPVFRFDHRGFGDSPAPAVGFEHSSPDIAAAIDAFEVNLPQLQTVVIWGLCDAASAALFYSRDPRVRGLVLANPWVRTDAGIAESYVRRYYFRRLLSRQLWRDLWRGRLQQGSLASFASMAATTVGARLCALVQRGPEAGESRPAGGGALPQRMLRGLQSFDGRVLFILSGDDLTAGEFKDCVSRSRAWRKAMQDSRVEQRDLPDANHTFSRSDWRDAVARMTADWLRSW